MADPQGLILFSGVEALLRASFTLSHGVTPSTCSLEMVPQTRLMPSVGLLELSWGSTKILFPDCRVSNCDLIVDSEGRQTWALTIQDTRWRWARGRISGEYNLRRHDGSPRPNTLRTPQQLLTLLLLACGLKPGKFDVGQVPNNVVPEKVWEYANAPAELASLVEELGCRVCLGPGNTVKVCRSGVGAPLPLGGDVLDNSLSLQPADRPDVLRFVGGRTLYQMDLRLEAVGRDLDGAIKPIDQLSYKPAEGWGAYDPKTGNGVGEKHGVGVERDKARDLALKWIYKAYRPVAFDFDGEVGIAIERILPITDKLVTTHKVDGVDEAEDAICFGQFSSGHANPVNNVDAVKADINGIPSLVFRRGFSVDKELGIVTFEEAVYRMSEWIAGKGCVKHQPVLYLRTAVGLRDKNTMAFAHFEQDLPLPGVKYGTLPEIVLHDEVVKKYWQVFEAGAVVTKRNDDDVKKKADFYLAAAALNWIDKTPGSVTYGGLKNIPVDGAIQQVSWWVDDEGRAYTRGNRNRDDPAAPITYKERRYYEQVLGMISKTKDPPDPDKKVRR
jgi:hypothetical protein